MQRFEEACSEFGVTDKKPALDGKILSVVISPKKAK
jgi:translation initiation factor IF-3